MHQVFSSTEHGGEPAFLRVSYKHSETGSHMGDVCAISNEDGVLKLYFIDPRERKTRAVPADHPAGGAGPIGEWRVEVNTDRGELVVAADRRVVLRTRVWVPHPRTHLSMYVRHFRITPQRRPVPFLMGAFSIDHIFVVNLKRRRDRRDMIEHKLRRIGVEPRAPHLTFVEAVDGLEKEQEFREYQSWYQSIHGHTRNHISVDPGAITYNMVNSAGAFGLLCTYRSMLARILREGHRRVMVLEDDCCFMDSDSMKKHTEAVPGSVRKTSDIVRLGTNQQKWDAACTPCGGHYTASMEPYHWPLGTFANVLSREAVAHLQASLSDPALPNFAYRGTVDFLLWMVSKTHRLADVVLCPNLAIADVSESDNIGSRSQTHIAAKCRWDLERYYFGPGRDRITGPCFVFVVASYNNAEWVTKNIESMCAQKYTHWRAIYVDDASTDCTLEAAQAAVRERGKEDRFTYIRAERRGYPAHSRYMAYNHRSCKPDEIAVFLDGDDWLLHTGVLCTLAKMYIAHGLKASYGQFMYYDDNTLKQKSGILSYPQHVIDARGYRRHTKWCAQHLRTAEVSVLQQIPATYLQMEGEWLRCCTDIVEMMFVLEHSGGKHMNIGEPLLVYNQMNSKNHVTSYYNRKQYPREQAYRQQVLSKYAPGLVERE